MSGDEPSSLPPGLLEGIELFNRGEYHAAHEVMERAWRETPGPERVLFQGLIQLAVALWRIENRRHDIALTMCQRAAPKFDQFRPKYAEIDVEYLYEAIGRIRAALVALGPERIAEFDRRLFPRIDLRAE